MMAGAAEEGDVDVDIVRVMLRVVGLGLMRWRDREERRRAGRIDCSGKGGGEILWIKVEGCGVGSANAERVVINHRLSKQMTPMIKY